MPKLVLALDTATLTLSIALGEVDAGGVRALEERAFAPPMTHSDALPAELVALLAAHGRTLDDVGGLCVGLGPGSFTGLRIGVATAKALAYGRQIPLAGASSLGAMAAVVARTAPEGARLCACLDARRGQVYAATYRVHGSVAVPESAEAPMTPEALAALVAEAPTLVFGNGAPERHAPLTPPAAGILHLAAPKLGSYSVGEVMALEPTYLRNFDAR